MLFGRTPTEIGPDLCYDADPGSSGLGQGPESIPASEPVSEPTQSAEVFFDYDYGVDKDDGSPLKGSFKTKEELANAFRENFFRRSDYTKKTTALAEERKLIDKQKEEYAAKETALLRMQEQQKELDAMVKRLSQPQYQRLLRELQQDRNTDPRMAELLEWRQKEEARVKQEAEERKKAEEQDKFLKSLESGSAYLKGLYPDFDQEKVIAEIKAMQEEPESEQLLRLMRYAHYGLAHNAAPAKPAKPSPLGGQSATTGGGGTAAFKGANLDEARTRAMKELGV